MTRVLPLIIGLTLLTGCSQEQPTVIVETSQPMIEVDTVKTLFRYKTNGTMIGTGNYLSTFSMPVVTFDSRMVHDPDFKASVVRFEYQ